MSPRRVFLTGASGNVGAAVLSELVRRGIEVVALVRKSVPNQQGYRPVFGDLSRVRDLAAEILQADGIIHCASPRTDDRAQALREDIEGTANLLDLWQAGAFIFTSSQTVYGIPKDVLRESDLVSASGWYDVAKICNEQQIHMTAHSGGRGAGVSLRLPLVFPSGPRRRDRQFFAVLFDALMSGKTFLFGSELALETSGSVYIGEPDVGSALVDALGIKATGPYNVAGGFCTWKDLLETLSRYAGVTLKISVRPNLTAGKDEFRLPQSRSFYDCARESLDDVIERFVRAERSKT
jgi:nucleoside-diphosphate-sugar epimerase